MLRISAQEKQAVAAVEAIRQGDVSGLRAQLEADPKLARATIVDDHGVGRTLLHVVADWPGHFPNAVETVEILVAAGADVDAALLQGPNGSAETPLHWAASSDDVDLIDALLDAGANIEAPGAIFTDGSPMSDAIIFAQWRAARRLLERGAKTTIWQAAALGLLDLVRQRCEAQPPPSTEEITNAFWHACRGGQLVVAQYLHSQGADIHWVGHDQKTPLDVARESDGSDLVHWLEERSRL